MTSRSAHVTDAIIAYDEQQLQERPGALRSAYPSILPGTVAGFIIARGDNVLVMGPRTGREKPFVPDEPRSMLDEGEFLVVANPSAKRALLRLAHGYPDLSRALRFEYSLPMPPNFPMLTEALARKYWGSATQGIAAWQKMVGVSSSGLDLMNHFVALCQDSTDPAPESLMTSMRNSGRNGLLLESKGGEDAANRAFRHASRFGDSAAALESCDPLLRERNLMMGSIVSASVLEFDAGRRELVTTVEGNFRMRVGYKVYLLLGPEGKNLSWNGAIPEVDLSRTFYTGGDLRARFTFSQNSVLARMRASDFDDIPLHLASAPFGAFAKTTRGRKVDRTVPLRRAVPLDVLAAGNEEALAV